MPDPSPPDALPPRYVVWVDFRIHPDALDAFLPLMLRNAQASLSREPGCERFDVLLPEADAAAVSLYEIYADRAAFQAHLASDHYREFDQATRAMVQAKAVRTFLLPRPGAS